MLAFLALVFLSTSLTDYIAECAGPCDTEDFAPIPPQGNNYGPVPWKYGDVRVWSTEFYFNYLPSRLQDKTWSLRFDLLRTESCTSGTSKDIYDFVWLSDYPYTNVPGRWGWDIEERTLLCRIIPIPDCDEEAEFIIYDAHELAPGVNYYIDYTFRIKSTGWVGVHWEAEFEPDSTWLPTRPPQEWCTLRCIDYNERG